MKQSTHRSIQFLILVENFPSFVTSKAKYDSVSINFNNTKWYISINLCKYCQTKKDYISVTPSSSDQPETLAANVCGERSDQKECSFSVDATFKFKRPSTAREKRYSQKFIFESTDKGHYGYDSWGYVDFGKIDVILTL